LLTYKFTLQSFRSGGHDLSRLVACPSGAKEAHRKNIYAKVLEPLNQRRRTVRANYSTKRSWTNQPENVSDLWMQIRQSAIVNRQWSIGWFSSHLLAPAIWLSKSDPMPDGACQCHTKSHSGAALDNGSEFNAVRRHLILGKTSPSAIAFTYQG
jgi:hypothetical protein